MLIKNGWIDLDRVRELVHCPTLNEREPDGRRIGVAVLDTGLSPHPDFISYRDRVIVFQDFLHGRGTLYDDCAHGTHVTGILGGSGFKSAGKYVGIAPGADLIALKVLDHKGNGNTKDVLAGIDWIRKNRKKYNIRLVNISVGTTSNLENQTHSELLLGVEDMWDLGIVVVTAAGNNGPKPQSVTIPGISRKVITVGCSDDQYYCDSFGQKKRNYSGRGPTADCVIKPDILAPGSHTVSCNGRFHKHGEGFYTVKSGTSMATPVVTGAIARLLSKNPDMSNLEVKLRLRETADDLGLPKNQQGWGLLNIRKLLNEKQGMLLP